MSTTVYVYIHIAISTILTNALRHIYSTIICLRFGDRLRCNNLLWYSDLSIVVDRNLSCLFSDQSHLDFLGQCITPL